MVSWDKVLEDFAAIHLSHYMAQIVVIAAPLLLMLLLIDLAFGILAKTADKLEPNAIAQPLKGAVATIMIALFVGVYFQEVQPQLALKTLAQDIEAWVRNAPPAR